MEKIIDWLKQSSDNKSGYSEELYKEGVALAEAHIKNKALLQSFKPKVVTPMRKKLLFNSLMRVAQLTEKMLEKKSEQPLNPNPETEEEKVARLAAAEKKEAAAKKKASQKPTPKTASQK